MIITIIITLTSVKELLGAEKILCPAAFVIFLKTKEGCLTLNVLLMVITKQLDQRVLILNIDDPVPVGQTPFKAGANMVQCKITAETFTKLRSVFL